LTGAGFQSSSSSSNVLGYSAFFIPPGSAGRADGKFLAGIGFAMDGFLFSESLDLLESSLSSELKFLFFFF
jgi:hypothetical protein